MGGKFLKTLRIFFPKFFICVVVPRDESDLLCKTTTTSTTSTVAPTFPTIQTTYINIGKLRCANIFFLYTILADTLLEVSRGPLRAMREGGINILPLLNCSFKKKKSNK